MAKCIEKVFDRRLLIQRKRDLNLILSCLTYTRLLNAADKSEVTLALFRGEYNVSHAVSVTLGK
jgi:hypothetical protein